MIIEQQNILFSKWQEKRKYNDFIKDGVFCEEEYVKQPLKILYVLKEANWNGSVNLCEWILSEPKSGYWRTWNNIARWTKALIEGGEYPHYVSKTDKSYWVKKIAFLNLKKVGGGAKANKDEISEYAIRDKKFIKENVELLINGKRVESDYTFTADSETMKVEVAFTFDATSLDGKQLGGLDRPTSGSVVVRGKELMQMKDEQLTIFRRRNVGFVFQNYNLLPILNVYENIVYPIEIDGSKVDKEFVRQIIHNLGLERKLKNMPNNLSGGQQQRVAIARALATKPAIILADEPTGNLDSKTSMDVILLMQSISREFNQTILMITHNEEIAQMADRIIRIEDGKVVSGGVGYAR